MANFTSPLSREFFEKGFSDSCPIIDMHAHMFAHAGARMVADSPEKVLGFMGRANVRLTLFASHRALMDGISADCDLEVWKRSPEKFRLYFPVLSRKANPEKDLRTVEENPAYAGFKFLSDYYSIPLEDPLHEAYFEYADARKMPVLCHTWGGSRFNGVENVRKVLKKYKNLSLLAGHSFRGDEDSACAAGKEFENLFFELTAVLSARGRLEKFMDAGFADRIVFGVDAPWFSYHSYVGALLSADISDADRRKILFENAKAVLEKSGLNLSPFGL